MNGVNIGCAAMPPLKTKIAVGRVLNQKAATSGCGFLGERKPVIGTIV